MNEQLKRLRDLLDEDNQASLALVIDCIIRKRLDLVDDAAAVAASVIETGERTQAADQMYQRVFLALREQSAEGVFRTITDERFNQLVNGPLHHPMPMFSLMRMMMALRFVVDTTGEAGERALEEHCAERQAADEESPIEDF
jgi:hypothetical protein